jgi:hypothetical protein
MTNNWIWVAISTLFVVGAQAVVFFRWIYRRMRDDDIMRTCVRDIATKQLPYFHEALRVLARRQGIYLDDPPPVQYVDLELPRWKAG